MIKYKIWSTWNRPTCVVVSLLSQGRSIRDLLEIIQATARENNKGHEIYWNMRTSSLKKWNSGWRLTKSQFCKGTGGLGGEMRGLKGHRRKMSVCRWPGCNELDTLKNLKEERSSWTVRRTVRLRAEWQAGLLCHSMRKLNQPSPWGAGVKSLSLGEIQCSKAACGSCQFCQPTRLLSAHPDGKVKEVFGKVKM